MSTEYTNGEVREKEGDSADLDKDAFQQQFESLQIPKNIDPRLLEIWLQREREAIESRQGTASPKRSQVRQGRPLSILFAAFIGITVMCLTIVLGLVQGKESGDVLSQACQSFLVYTIIGFFVGCIAEYCVADSVETLLREIVRRGEETSDSPEQADSAPSEAEPVVES